MAATMNRGPDEGEGIVWPALRVGATAGVAGLLFGGVTGIIRSPTPILWATVSSIQWALLGGSYWGVRSAFLQSRVEDEITPQTNVYASAFAGGLSAAGVGALTRGRANVIPGAIMGTLTGYIGQKGYSMLDKQHTVAVTLNDEAKEPIWQQLANSKYSPVTVLSNEQYEAMLKEKLLRVDTEIAVIDDDIANLRRQRKGNPTQLLEKSKEEK